MNKKFLINILFLVLLNLLIKPFWFLGIEVTVQNRLGNEQYGMYFSLLSFAMIFNFLLDVGITNFNNREIARHQHLLSNYFSNIAIIKIILGFLYFVLCLIGGLFVGYNRYQITLLLLLMLNQFLSSYLLYLRSNINGMLMFVTDSILSVLDKALMIGILSVLLWSNVFHGAFHIEWFVYSQTVSLFISVLLAMALVLKKSEYFIPSFNFKYVIVILKKSFPFSILVLLMFLYNRMEPVLLERLLKDGLYQAGIYAQGFRIMEVLSNFSYLFPVLLLPLFAKLLKEKKDIGSLVSLSSALLIFPSIIIGFTCALYGSNLMGFMYGQSYNGHVFSVIILGYIGISISYIFGTLLTANGNLKYLNTMAICAVVLNFSLNLILIPRYKAFGAALASCFTQSITSIFQMVLAYRVLHLSASKHKIYRVAVWLLLFVVALLFINLYVHVWLLAITLSVLTGFGLLFGLRLVPVKSILSTMFSAVDTS